MSSIRNWTKKAKKQPYYAGERSPTPCERALGARSPIPANVRTQASLNQAGALDNVIATPCLLVEVGN
jgi:hypothetical protein